MLSPDSRSVELAQSYGGRVAGEGLRPADAKLYSQFSRLQSGQPPLSAWDPTDAGKRLEEALNLIEAASIHEEAGLDPETKRRLLRKSAELLEWLSHPKISANSALSRLLAGGLYQMAGYPARAAGLLKSTPSEEDGTSHILWNLFRGDFGGLAKELSSYWSSIQSRPNDTDRSELEVDVPSWMVRETIRCIGVVTAWLRWGEDERLHDAIQKLRLVARLTLYSTQPYSWLVGTLVHQVCLSLTETALRTQLIRQTLNLPANTEFAKVIENYCRVSFLQNKVVAWPSQVAGLSKLLGRESFALCTPTGSGKTTIAEVALLQGLFRDVSQLTDDGLTLAPLALYLVPSRALAAEVESKLDRVLGTLTDEKITVTGLYGGIDWGPTDAWVTRNDPTVLICTYEKAEALVRFLGGLFLGRLKLVIFDEAHSVQFDETDSRQLDSLREGQNRALRLESLITRIMAGTNPEETRLIALSAVIGGAQDALDMWIRRETEPNPVQVKYWSTRRLIGRLQCLPSGRFQIRYDVMDDHRLTFDRGSAADGPFVPAAFAPMPAARAGLSPEVLVRPYALWAALSMAAETGNKQSVLISVPMRVEWYAKTFLECLEQNWTDVAVPQFFVKPDSLTLSVLYERALQSCADYFGKPSYEYRLLIHGIIMHHGAMPPRLSRLLIELVEKRVVRVVLATSTLSDGLNLPFDVVLIPNLRRQEQAIPFREFANLAGRAGRPGNATEGRCLVLEVDRQLLSSDKHLAQAATSEASYKRLVAQMVVGDEASRGQPHSPLVALLSTIKSVYESQLAPGGMAFYEWLERVAPESAEVAQDAASEYVDTLDGVILSSLVEHDMLNNRGADASDFEDTLRNVWRRTYAFAAVTSSEQWETLFLTRGKAVVTDVYPDAARRKRLYRTSLPPRYGKQLLSRFQAISEFLKTGADYARWDHTQRFEYVWEVVRRVTALSAFAPPSEKLNGEDVLRWWLWPSAASRQPTPDKITGWFKYVNSNFLYRFSWGLGSVIALTLDETTGEGLQSTSLQDWPSTQLPWVVFWMKELFVWGTLDPVAAYLLAKDKVRTRDEAESEAKRYYESRPGMLSADEVLNAAEIRDWAEHNFPRADHREKRPPSEVQVYLCREFSAVERTRWRVFPTVTKDEILWVDAAGFVLAKSDPIRPWTQDWAREYDFVLDSSVSNVAVALYVGR